MDSWKLSDPSIVTTVLLGATLPLSSPTFALPAMEVRVENFLFQAEDIKKSLNLNQNQQVLWQQVESKARALLRARQTRREHLQETLKTGLGKPKAELRDLAKEVDQEAELSTEESRQLRELWLTMNDALDDSQRQTILSLLADQLQRQPDQGHEQRPMRQGGESHGHGMGRQKTGGGMQ